MDLLEKRKCQQIGFEFMRIVTFWHILHHTQHQEGDEMYNFLQSSIDKNLLKYILDNTNTNTKVNAEIRGIVDSLSNENKENMLRDINAISQMSSECVDSRELYETLNKMVVPTARFDYEDFFPTMRRKNQYQAACFENFGMGTGAGADEGAGVGAGVGAGAGPTWGLNLVQEELCERYTRTNSSKITRERAIIDLSRCRSVIGTMCAFSAYYEGRTYVFFGEMHKKPDHNVPYDPNSISIYSFLQCIFEVSPEMKYDLFIEEASENDKSLSVGDGDRDKSMLSFTDNYFENYLKLRTRDFEDIHPNLRVHNLDARERAYGFFDFPKRILVRKPSENLYELLEDPVITKELNKLKNENIKNYLLNFAKLKIDFAVNYFTGANVGDDNKISLFARNPLGSGAYNNDIRLSPSPNSRNLEELLESFRSEEDLETSEFVSNIYAALTDVYASARMLRKFEDFESNYVIVFAGAGHTINYFEIFSNLPGCRIIQSINRTIENPGIFWQRGIVYRQYLRNISTTEVITARALAQEYFGISPHVLETNFRSPFSFKIFSQINIHQSLEKISKELLVICDLTKALANREINVWLNELFYRALYKYYVYLNVYLNKIEIVADGEFYNKLLKTLEFFVRNSKTNYTKFHETLFGLLLKASPNVHKRRKR